MKTFTSPRLERRRKARMQKRIDAAAVIVAIVAVTGLGIVYNQTHDCYRTSPEAPTFCTAKK